MPSFLEQNYPDLYGQTFTDNPELGQRVLDFLDRQAMSGQGPQLRRPSADDSILSYIMELRGSGDRAADDLAKTLVRGMGIEDQEFGNIVTELSRSAQEQRGTPGGLFGQIAQGATDFVDWGNPGSVEGMSAGDWAGSAARVGAAAVGGVAASGGFGAGAASGSGTGTLTPVSLPNIAASAPTTVAAGGATTGAGALAALPASVTSGTMASLPAGIGAITGSGAGAAAGAAGTAGAAGAAGQAAANTGGAAVSGTPWWVTAAQIAGSLYGGDQAAGAAEDATDAQVQAGREALDYQRESRDIALGLIRPEIEASQTALAEMLRMTGQPVPDALATATGTTPGQGGYDVTTDPGYQFRLDEGMRAMEGSAAARGGLMSGGFARQALRYAQNYASNEYTNIYNRLASVANRQPVATNQANAALNFGGNAANIAMNTGDARASGYIAQGNSWQNTMDQIALAMGNQFGNRTAA